MQRDLDETSDEPLHDDDPLTPRPDASSPADEVLGDTDAPATDGLVPETQGDEPLQADLGAEGQGDLAPEDMPEAGTDDLIARINRGEDPEPS